MKTIAINTTLILVLIFSLLSCKKHPRVSEEEAYYNFDATDHARIPDHVVGQELLYKNENGGQITFTVSSFDLSEKVLYGEGMGFFSSYAAEYFYYDRLNVEYTDDSGYAYNVSYQKWPVNLESAKADPYKKQASTLLIQISFFPYWNEADEYGYPVSYLPVNASYGQIAILTINGKTYDGVLKIVSNSNVPFSEKRNVNVIYYYEGIGIIGFDDLDNNHWRLQ